MSDKKLLNRRQFLERAALLGAAAMGAGTLLSACEPSSDDAGEPAEQEPAADEGFSCNDEEALADLTEDEISRREEFEYVEQTTTADQRCDNCIHWQEPEGGADCGGCAILPGPFNPEGWCNQWIAAPS